MYVFNYVFLYASKEQKIDGLPPKKFLQKFYNIREKLEKFLIVISLFLKKCIHKMNVRLNLLTRNIPGH